MIRVATFDRHPTVRAGVDALLYAQPDLVRVGSAADRYELFPLPQRMRPNDVVLDHRPGSDGLELCLRITSRPPAPRVLLFGADLGPEAIVPATLAGAEAMLDKAAPVRALLKAIRAVGAGAGALPAIPPGLQARAAARLAPQDRAILAMRLAGTSTTDMAGAAGLRTSALRARLSAIVAVLGGAAESLPGDPLRAAA